MIPGPEKATFIERFVGILHLPYAIGCMIISILIGPPGAIILAYITTGDMGKAVSMTISFIAGVGTPYLMGVTILALVWLLLFYVFYMTRFMRQRLLSAEEMLQPVLPKGEQTFHEAFKLVTKLWPPVIIAIAGIVLYFISSSDYLITSFMGYTVHIANIIYLVIVYPLWFIACCTFAWVFFGSIYGLYKLGRKPLKLKSSSEDRMLGVKPFGNLSLSLSIVYFFAMAILIMMGIAASIDSPIIGIIAFTILLITFFTVGLVLFVAPLYTVHQRMVEQKEQERTQLRKRIYEGVGRTAEPGIQDTVAELKKKVDDLSSIVSIDMAEKTINSIPNWPIDTPIIGKLATIILSIIAILAAQLILQLFRL